MEPLKNLINPEVVTFYANSIYSQYPDFNPNDFKLEIIANLSNLELKQRSKLIAAKLHLYLPDDYKTACSILEKVLGKPAENEQNITDNGFKFLPISDFIEHYGINDFETSFNLMYQLTQRLTAEFAIRPFIIKYPKAALKIINEWAVDENLHVRRLASESTRPYLPWGMNLLTFVKNPTPVLEILDKLKNDSSRYVQKSVANNLNSISKDHPNVVIQTLKEWNKASSPSIQWITKHALRTLFKVGDKNALSLMGFNEPKAKISDLKLTPITIKMGESICFEFNIQSNAKKPQLLMIDYAIHFMKANRKQQPKVFKLTTKKLGGGEKASVKKQHSFKPITTRKYYKGEQLLAIQINGVTLAKQPFNLI